MDKSPKPYTKSNKGMKSIQSLEFHFFAFLAYFTFPVLKVTIFNDFFSKKDGTPNFEKKSTG